MSYQVMLIRFEHGSQSPVALDKWQQIAKPYGHFVEHHNEWCFLSDVGELCDNANLLGDSENGFYGIMFDRPSLHEKLPEIIFDLLSIENSCFFGVDMEFLQSRSNMFNHLPEIFQETFPSGPQILQDAFSFWSLK